jgi:hypothetical protein
MDEIGATQMTSRLQRIALEIAFDAGADVHEVAVALELARTSSIYLTVTKSAADMRVHAKELNDRRGGFRAA